MERCVIVLQPTGIELPGGIGSLAEFRTWTGSDRFPSRGRIDWIQDRMEVDMAPEDLNTHGGPKSTVSAQLVALLQVSRRGAVFIDRARLTCPAANLSVEPDILVILRDTLRSGAARLVPKASAAEGRFVEIEGRADLVVEFVSDSSTAKDKRELRDAYAQAGIPEYWLIDVRRDPIVFDLLQLCGDRYELAPAQADGFCRSPLLDREVRLRREAELDGLVFFTFDVRATAPGV